MRDRNQPNKMFAELLHKQYLVFSRGQVAKCGITEDTLRWRTRPGGPWQRLLQGVYLACTGTPTADQRDMAALLFAGPGSVLTAWAAMRRLGMTVPQISAVDVLVPAARRRRGGGFVRVHRTNRIPEFVCASGQIGYVLPARAVADVVRGMRDLREVRAVVANSVQRD